MPKYLIDEDLPRSLAAALRSSHVDAVDVRDVGLRGAKDPEVFAYAQREGRILVTADVGFGNEMVHPPGTHRGIVLARLPTELPAPQIVASILRALQGLGADEAHGAIVIVEPTRLRVRGLRPKAERG